MTDSTNFSAGTVVTSDWLNEVDAHVFDDLVSVKRYGAVGDGVTDDRAAIVAAVAAARGKTLYFPEGQYLIDTDGGTILLEEVRLLGELVHDGSNATVDQGSVFRITGTSTTPFTIRRGVSIEGLGFYYPNISDSATPTAHAVTLAFDFTNGAVQFVYIRDNVVFNAYQFLDINDVSGGVGHVWIENNTVCALNRGIYIRHNAEHIRISGNNFTFGHWLSATEGNARTYARTNCTLIKIDQSDGIEIIDNLFFGALNGVLMAASGLCQFMHIGLNKFDQTRYSIKATGTGNFDGTVVLNTFNSFNSQDTTLQGRSIDITTSGGTRESLTIAANNFKSATDDHIYVSGNTPTRDIVVTGCNFVSWAGYKASGSYGALNISGNNTNLVISGCWLAGSNNSAYSNGIMGSCNTFSCTGVSFNGCKQALNISTTSTTGSGNVSYATNDATSDQVTGTTLYWGPNNFDKPYFSTPLVLHIDDVPTYANDATAAGDGIPIGGVYRNGSVLQIRVT